MELLSFRSNFDNYSYSCVCVQVVSGSNFYVDFDSFVCVKVVPGKMHNLYNECIIAANRPRICFFLWYFLYFDISSQRDLLVKSCLKRLELLLLF